MGVVAVLEAVAVVQEQKTWLVCRLWSTDWYRALLPFASGVFWAKYSAAGECVWHSNAHTGSAHNCHRHNDQCHVSSLQLTLLQHEVSLIVITITLTTLIASTFVTVTGMHIRTGPSLALCIHDVSHAVA